MTSFERPGIASEPRIGPPSGASKGSQSCTDAPGRSKLVEELDRTRRKCFQLREEVRNLHAAFDKSETAALRAEAAGYRKALSNIAHRLEQDGHVDPLDLRRVVDVALESRNMKPSRRRLVEGRADG